MANWLNKNIKTLRLQRNLSQVDFANQMGVTKQCVSNWENDNVLPSIEMLVRIADFFHVSTDYLLGREDASTLNVSGLTEEQIGHVSLLVDDIRKLNQKNG